MDSKIKITAGTARLYDKIYFPKIDAIEESTITKVEAHQGNNVMISLYCEKGEFIIEKGKSIFDTKYGPKACLNYDEAKAIQTKLRLDQVISLGEELKSVHDAYLKACQLYLESVKESSEPQSFSIDLD